MEDSRKPGLIQAFASRKRMPFLLIYTTIFIASASSEVQSENVGKTCAFEDKHNCVSKTFECMCAKAPEVQVAVLAYGNIFEKKVNSVVSSLWTGEFASVMQKCEKISTKLIIATSQADSSTKLTECILKNGVSELPVSCKEAISTSSSNGQLKYDGAMQAVLSNDILRKGTHVIVILPSGAPDERKESGTSTVEFESISHRLKALAVSTVLIVSENDKWAGNPLLDNSYDNGEAHNGIATLFKVRSVLKAGEKEGKQKQIGTLQETAVFVGTRIRLLKQECVLNGKCADGLLIISDVLASARDLPFDSFAILKGLCENSTIIDGSSEQASLSFDGLPLVEASPSPSPRKTKNVRVIDWSIVEEDFGGNFTLFAVEELSQSREPLIVKNTNLLRYGAVEEWLSDDFSAFHDALQGLENEEGFLEGVRIGEPPFYFWDPDQTLHELADWQFKFSNASLSSKTLLNAIFKKDPKEKKHYYYLGDMPDELQEDINSTHMFLTEADREKNGQYIWITTEETITHTHCDMDFNLFIQAYGNKTFEFYAPHTMHHLQIFPRIHPLWHKSQITDYSNLPPTLTAHLEPYDFLYVPPYWFHRVTSHSPSISITSWSLAYDHYERMDGIYRYEPKYTRLAKFPAILYTMRMYLDLLIQKTYGRGRTEAFFKVLLGSRYTSSLASISPYDNQTIVELCVTKDNVIPTRKHVVEDTRFDSGVVSNLFHEIVPETRDLMFLNYVEEMTSAVIGIEGTYAFFKHCFKGQPYVLSEDDDLWDEAEQES